MSFVTTISHRWPHLTTWQAVTDGYMRSFVNWCTTLLTCTHFPGNHCPFYSTIVRRDVRAVNTSSLDRMVHVRAVEHSLASLRLVPLPPVPRRSLLITMSLCILPGRLNGREFVSVSAGSLARTSVHALWLSRTANKELDCSGHSLLCGRLVTRENWKNFSDIRTDLFSSKISFSHSYGYVECIKAGCAHFDDGSMIAFVLSIMLRLDHHYCWCQNIIVDLNFRLL